MTAPVDRRQRVRGRLPAWSSVAAFAMCAASAMALPPRTTVDILGPEDGGVQPPPHLLIIDVMVNVDSDDTWTTAGFRGTASNGAELVYLSDEEGTYLTTPGFSSQFVTFVSGPQPRTSSIRFTATTASVVGAYSPAAPNPVTAAGTVNVGFFRFPVPLPGQFDGVNGAIARVALDVSGVTVPSGWHPVVQDITSSAPPTGGIPVFTSIGLPTEPGTISYSQDHIFDATGLDWGVYYVFAGDLDGNGNSDAADAEEFREAWRCRNCPASIAAADADHDGDLDCDDVALMREAQARAGREFYIYSIDGNAASGLLLDYGPAVAIQNTQTSLGDSAEGDIAVSSGSELDAAYAKIDCETLYVVLAGNLKNNSANTLLLFIDSKEGGQQRLLGDNEGPPHVLNVNFLGDDGTGNGLRFDADFVPDYMIAVENSGHGPGMPWFHVDFAEFPTEGGGTMFHVGNSSPGSVLFNYGNGENPGLFGALDNSNTGGVTAGTGEAYGDGVTTGLELGIPLSAIGDPQCGVRLCAMIISEDSGAVVSNQVLRPIGGGGALGPARSVNLAAVSRQQSFPSGAAFEESVKLVAPDGAAGDNLRYAAIEGDFAALGAPNHTHSGGPAGAGAVYIWRRVSDSWVFDREIRPSDLQSNDKFGSAVSMYGSFLVVGSPQDDDRGAQAGAAYIFQRNSVTGEWVQRQKITAADGSSGDNFGSSVVIWGTRIIVGAPGADGASPGSGAAYFFEFDLSLSFAQQRKMAASDGASGDGFGTSVGMWGEYALIGAPTDDHAAIDAGSAYVFRRVAQNFGATEHRVLRPAGLPASALFGRAVAMDGSIAACGASGAGVGGQAYAFARSGPEWNLTQTVSAADGASGDAFGAGIALGSQLLVVGASGDDVHFNEGSAYLFLFDGVSFTQAAKLNAPDGAAGDNLGGLGGLAIDGSYLLASAGAADPGGNSSQGAGYLFDLSVRPPIPVGEPARRDLILGQSDLISAPVSSALPVTFQWRRNGVPLTDGPTPWGTTLWGVNEVNLGFGDPHYQDAGEYDCVITNACGTAVSPVLTVRVLRLGDLNCDGLVDASDCAPMQLAFDDAPSYMASYPGCPIDNADFNLDGEVTPDDRSSYCQGPWLELSDCGSACNDCPADFDGNGTREVPDIFAFLSAWFAMSSDADFDGNGTIAVPDIFAFLSAWFEGCT